MPPLSVRMVMIFIIAVAFLNFSNYTLMRFYNPPIPRKTGFNKYTITTSVSSSRPSTRFTLNSKAWSELLLCGVNASTKNPNCIERHNKTPVTVYYNDIYDSDKSETAICPEMPPGLGPTVENRSASETYAAMYNLRPGGIYNTTTCVSRHSVAIIIPYRGFRTGLLKFLYILHPFLMKQQLNYQIFVVEQSNTSQPFNRGKLLNVGFTEARRHRHWDCYVFHEPNIVPVDSRNLYRCSWYPRQLAIRVERPSKSLLLPQRRPPYQPKIGGAFAMTSEQILKVNGFSNLYWGNDADYDDLFIRLRAANYLIQNTIRIIGKYRTLKNFNAPTRLSSHLTETISPLYLLEGLSTLSYTLDKFDLEPEYTSIQVNIEDEEALFDSEVWNENMNQPTGSASGNAQANIISSNVTTNVTH